MINFTCTPEVKELKYLSTIINGHRKQVHNYNNFYNKELPYFKSKILSTYTSYIIFYISSSMYHHICIWFFSTEAVFNEGTGSV